MPDQPIKNLRLAIIKSIFWDNLLCYSLKLIYKWPEKLNNFNLLIYAYKRFNKTNARLNEAIKVDPIRVFLLIVVAYAIPLAFFFLVTSQLLTITILGGLIIVPLFVIPAAMMLSKLAVKLFFGIETLCKTFFISETCHDKTETSVNTIHTLIKMEKAIQKLSAVDLQKYTNRDREMAQNKIKVIKKMIRDVQWSGYIPLPVTQPYTANDTYVPQPNDNTMISEPLSFIQCNEFSKHIDEFLANLYPHTAPSNSRYGLNKILDRCSPAKP